MNILKVLSGRRCPRVTTALMKIADAKFAKCALLLQAKRQLPHLNIDGIKLSYIKFFLLQLLRFYGLSSWTWSYCAAP